MTNPRGYPDVISSAESGRPLQRGVKMLTINVDGQPFTYGQPGWWASLDDPADTEGQFVDEDNLVRTAARREAKANAKNATLTPLVIKAIREACALSQQDAARVFGGGSKAFEKYEAGEVAPSSSMTRLLMIAAKQPSLFQKGSGTPMVSEADAVVIRDTVRKSSVGGIYERIYGFYADKEHRWPSNASKQKKSGAKLPIFGERRPQGDYAVRGPNARGASDVLPTQAEAVARAKQPSTEKRLQGARLPAANQGRPAKERTARGKT